MGQGKSKGDTLRKIPEGALEENNNANGTSNTTPTETSSVSDPELHTSWNDQVLYSKTGETKVSKEDFELLTVIGRGSFGKVSRIHLSVAYSNSPFKVMQVRKKSDGKIYAMKVLTKQSIIARKQVAHTRAEKTILEKVQHPFIVQLYYAFQSKEKLYMILEYVNGGELFLHLKKQGRFTEDRAKFYAAEIVSAMAHLHKVGKRYLPQSFELKYFA
jgi:serum/glucocorticoid-regulated kinase 2